MTDKPTGTKTGAIEVAFEALNDAISAIGAARSELQDKIAPVMASNTPSIVMEKANMKPSEESTAVGERIMQQTRRLVEIRELMQRMYHLVEL